jgi:hypothetical protein
LQTLWKTFSLFLSGIILHQSSTKIREETRGQLSTCVRHNSNSMTKYLKKQLRRGRTYFGSWFWFMVSWFCVSRPVIQNIMAERSGRKKMLTLWQSGSIGKGQGHTSVMPHATNDQFPPTMPYLLVAHSWWTHQWIDQLMELSPS